MTVYIAGFLISIFLLYYADSRQFRGRDAKIAVVVALLIPCLIAGLRGRNVGTDVVTYAEPLFLCAKSSTSFGAFYAGDIYIAEFYGYTAVSEYELGFLAVCYLSAKVFRSLPVMLFVLQALTVIPVYKGLRAFSDSQPVWLGMSVYFLMYFNHSLNMMRQWIAMAFLFYGFQFLTQRRSGKYFLMVAVAMMFHYSAIAAVGIFFLYQLVAKENTYNKALKMLLLILIGMVTILSLDVLVTVMTLLGLRYGNYFSGELGLMPNQILYRIPILLLLAWRWRYLKENTHYAYFFLLLIVYDLLASQLTSIFANSARIALFFGEYYMLAYPMICMASDSRKNRQTMKLFTLGYLSVYWVYTYVIMGSSSTVPYTSIFSG